MKCKTCNGLGRIKATELVGVDEGLREVVILCHICGGKGEVEPTEQEYIQTCNTEQLAEFLYNIRYDYQVPWKNKGVVEWLKQPHRDKE